MKPNAYLQKQQAICQEFLDMSQCISSDYCKGWNDAVDSVVRCKDCKYWHHSGWCKKIGMAFNRLGSDFCSYGKRREGE